MKLSIKSKFGAEYRRFPITIGTGLAYPTFIDFKKSIHDIHKLTDEQKTTITLSYMSKDGSSLPISNDENLKVALDTCSSTLRISVKNKGEALEDEFGYGISQPIMEKRKNRVSISSPQDFRRVSSILDADTLPMELRRVQLCKTYSNKPLGFFIRDGIWRSTGYGYVPTPGIFISRLVPHGLAESTNLLNVNDEILQVNGIDVSGKTLDQVTDMMLANAGNLILTTRPAIPMLPYPCFAMHPPPPPPYSYFPPGCRSPEMKTITLPRPIISSPFQYIEERKPLSPPMNWRNFSRESTWRISADKKTTIKRRPVRPFTVYSPTQFYTPPFGSPFAFG